MVGCYFIPSSKYTLSHRQVKIMPHRQSHIGPRIQMYANRISVFGTTSPIRRTEQNRKLGSTHTPPTTKHQMANSHRSTKRRRRGLITPPRKVSCPSCQEDMPVVPPQVVIAQVYPTVYSNKNTMSQHMRHNINTKGSNVYMLNRTNHQHKSPKYSNMYFLQLLK